MMPYYSFIELLNLFILNIKNKFKCRLFNWHEWTCNYEKGISPTQEQLNGGLEGFYEYAKMYCDQCGMESKISKQIRCKYKN